ncbi:MAG TPA: TonB-dependent receptor [Caulobacteraceae bacterium]|nr:TonB-dependent receptor [Caulobacteraceae bacterium]
MDAEQPPSVEVVIIRAVRLPPSPADAAFSIIHLDTRTLATSERLDDALTSVPGISLFRRTSSLGANPTTQGISLRGVAGSGASRALVTLDGVPQNDPFGGWVIWTSLPPESIAGATIVRGAGAGAYGAGALTGVVALQEVTPRPGDWTMDGELGNLGEARAAVTGAVAVGGGTLALFGDAEHSDGWTPVRQGAGAADTRLTLNDYAASARYSADIGSATGAARLSAFEEDRGSGLAGARARARGASFSLSAARAPVGGALGWSAQAWTLVSDLFNTSVSVPADRASTTLTDDQYRTPAIGYGVNAAVRRLWTGGSLDLGMDFRGAAGESRETFHPVAGELTFDRRAGGRTATGGLYAEATQRLGALLLAAGARVDGWETFDSHRLERSLVTDAVTLDERPADRGGILPSARLAVRWDLPAGSYVRAAAYSGFRAPTLNELFRPFRVGNDVTEANPDLVPERLYGGEIGAGGGRGPFALNATAFYNRLADAVTNVTIANGPYLDPVEGLIAAGGSLLQRRNVGSIDAFGVEADLGARLGEAAHSTVAVSWTHATVEGGTQAPQLTGLRPAQTPRLSADWNMAWKVNGRLTLTGALDYESARFDDDQNTRRLAPAASFDVRAEWRLTSSSRVFVAADNLFDVAVATGKTAAGVISYGPPRLVRIGVSVGGGPP